MKPNDEMCNADFAKLPINDKRWLLHFAYEAQRAREKHPAFGKDVVHSAAIVCEEAGELVRAALQNQYENGRYYDMHKEAIQTGASALRFVTEGAPELPWPPPPSKAKAKAAKP